MRRRAGYVAAAVLCLLGFSALSAPAAYAHASLVSTDPEDGAVLRQAPQEVTLTFDEPVSVVDEATRVYDAAGHELDTAATSVDEVVTIDVEQKLSRGTFVVAYRAVSDDGHPVAGSLSFSVGTPSETVVAPSADVSTPGLTTVKGGVQAVTYVALLLAAGLTVFLALVLPDDPALGSRRARLARVVKVAAGLAVLGALVSVPLATVYQLGLGLPGLGTRAAWVGLHAADGLPFLLVLAGCGVTAGVLGAHRPDRIDRAVLVVAMGTAVGSLALAGHTRAYGPAALVIPADVAHVAAAAVWFGGLVGLWLTWDAMGDELAARTLARFSSLAAVTLTCVALAGLVLGWRILGSWSALVSTSYGVLLLAKLAVVGLVVTVAWWNRTRLLPRTLDGGGARGDVRTAVRLEALGLVVVLLVTGFLVDRVPREEPEPTSPASPRDTMTAVGGDVRVVARLDPGVVGRNTVTLRLQDASGRPLQPYSAPRVSWRSGDVALGRTPTRRLPSGAYRASVVLPRPGTWELQVSVRTDEFSNPVLTLTTEVGG